MHQLWAGRKIDCLTAFGIAKILSFPAPSTFNPSRCGKLPVEKASNPKSRVLGLKLPVPTRLEPWDYAAEAEARYEMSYLQTQNASLAASNERLQMELNTWTTLVALLRIHGYNCVSEQVTFYPFWWWEVIGVANQENLRIEGRNWLFAVLVKLGQGLYPRRGLLNS